RIIDILPDARLNCPVERVARDEAGVWLQTRGGTQRFDDVVFACHSDQALAILGEDASPSERMVLSSVRYQANRAVLHTDLSLLPRREKVWSAWNYLAGSAAEGTRPVS
ncbi:hypothetical protein RZS08_21560, partial [Arthrospira platensis SPKY1]|nr:hypothetical protein [Arthrospira platensis SPKY1]